MYTTRTMTKMSVCVAIICVSAYLSFPIPFSPVPFTCLTLSMLLTAFLLTPAQTFIVLLVYMLLGAAGLPVFAGGSGGAGVLVSPGGGYLFGFIAAYPLTSLLKGTRPSLMRYFLAGLISLPFSYIFGIIGLIILTKISVSQAFLIGVLPFLPGDILKDLTAAYIGIRLQRLLP